MLKTNYEGTTGSWDQTTPAPTTQVVRKQGAGFTPQTAYGRVDSGGLFERNQAEYERRVQAKENVTSLVWTPDRVRSHGEQATRFYGTATYRFSKGEVTWILNEHYPAMQGWADGTEAIKGLNTFKGVDVNEAKQVFSEENLLKIASRNKVG